MCAAVISCCHAPPVFEPAKHVFDLMALFIQGFGVSGGGIPPLSGWNAGHDPFGFKRGSELIAIITFITKQVRSALRQGGVDQFCPNMIVHIAFAQAHDNRATFTVTNRM